MPVYERLSMVVSLNLIGLALYFIIDLPSQVYTFNLLNTTVSLTASQRLLMVILLGGLAFTGAGAVIRSHPEQRTRYTVPFWVNPMLLVILATFTLAQLGSPQRWAIGLAVTGVLLWFSILAEYYIIEQNTPRLRVSQLWSQWISYALLLAYGALLYQARLSIFANLLAILVLTWLLARSILKLYAPQNGNQGLFAFLIAFSVSQIAWVLQYWQLQPADASLLILLIFYGLTGIVISYFRDRLEGRVIMEYGLVVVLGGIIITQLI
jgi:hypothetical protein